MLHTHLTLRFALHQLLHWASVGILFPVLVLTQLDKGLDLLQVGVVMALYSTTVILLEVPTGGLADQLGRKQVYLISVVIKLIAIGLFIFSSTPAMITLVFILYGASRALDSGSIDAWFVDTFHEQHPGGDLQKALALSEIASLAGLAGGSLIGGMLPDLSMHLSLFSGRYTANMAAALGLLLITGGDTITVIHEHQIPDDTHRPTLSGHLLSALSHAAGHRTLRLLLLSSLTLGIGLSTVESFWQPRAAQIMGDQAGSWVYGVLSAAYFLFAAAGSALSILLARGLRGNYRLLLTVMRILYGVCLCSLAAQQQLPGFALLFVLLFSFSSVESSPYETMLNKAVHASMRSTILSLSSAAFQIGGAAGAFAGGLIAARWGIPPVWFAAGVLLTGSSLCYLMIHPDQQ